MLRLDLRWTTIVCALISGCSPPERFVAKARIDSSAQVAAVVPTVKLANTSSSKPPFELADLRGITIRERSGSIEANVGLHTEFGGGYNPRVLATLMWLYKKVRVFRVNFNDASMSSRYLTTLFYDRRIKQLVVYNQSTMSGTMTSESRTICSKVTDQAIFSTVIANRDLDSCVGSCQTLNLADLKNRRK